MPMPMRLPTATPPCASCGLRHPLVFRFRGQIRQWHESQVERLVKQAAGMRRALQVARESRASAMTASAPPPTPSPRHRPLTRHELLLRALTADRSVSA